jgi:hypothetical protein
MSFSTKIFFLFLWVLLFAALSGCAKRPAVFKPVPEKVPPKPLAIEAGIEVIVNGQRVSPLVPTLFLLPEESLLVHVRNFPGSRSSVLKAESWSILLTDQVMTAMGNNLFSGKAPKEPGLYGLEIECRQIWAKKTASPNSREEGWEEITRQSLLAIVLRPFSGLKDGFIDQFPVGFYPNPEEARVRAVQTAPSQYLPPLGFIEVTPENKGVLVSRHYLLNDFICHANPPFPHYMALSPAILLKLELLTLKLRQNGMPEARLTVLSGFRTPWYNQTVFGAKWSRHIYGDAVDITLDTQAPPGLPEDISLNGRQDRNNIRVMAGLIEEIEEETGLVGGLGIYDLAANGNQCPFIHMDTRGFKARW